MHELADSLDLRALIKVAGVITLLVAAAATASPPGRLPLALRGLKKILAADSGVATAPAGRKIPAWKKTAAFLLTVAAALLALW